MKFPELANIDFSDLCKIALKSTDEYLRQWILNVEPNFTCSHMGTDELLSVLGELHTSRKYPDIYKGRFENLINEHDIVNITGTVIHIYPDNKTVVVETMSADGTTVFLTMRKDQLTKTK